MFRHVEKAKIQLRESLGQALETAYRQLKAGMAHTHDLDEDIKVSSLHALESLHLLIGSFKMAHMPDHLQLLVSYHLNTKTEALNRPTDQARNAT